MPNSDPNQRQNIKNTNDRLANSNSPFRLKINAICLRILKDLDELSAAGQRNSESQTPERFRVDQQSVERCDDSLLQDSDDQAPKTEKPIMDLGTFKDPLGVSMESFFELNFEISNELDELVANYDEKMRIREWNQWGTDDSDEDSTEFHRLLPPTESERSNVSASTVRKSPK